MNRQLATAGQGLTKDGGHGWFRAIPQRQEKLLGACNGFFHLLPLSFPAQPEQHHQIGADAEVLPFVGDDEALVLCFRFRHRFADHAEDISVERVRFGMKFEANDAIAEVEQTCTSI